MVTFHKFFQILRGLRTKRNLCIPLYTHRSHTREMDQNKMFISQHFLFRRQSYTLISKAPSQGSGNVYIVAEAAPAKKGVEVSYRTTNFTFVLNVHNFILDKCVNFHTYLIIYIAPITHFFLQGFENPSYMLDEVDM